MDAARPEESNGSWLRMVPPARETLVLGVILAFLACLPFAVTHLPQMTDYPSHLASFRVMLDQGQDPYLSRYYAINWRWTGNMGADLLMWPLSRLFGLEPAGRVLGAAIPILTGLGIICVERALRGRVTAGGLLAFVCIWSPSVGQGFYNFTLSLALALLAFALWVRLEGHRWRALVFVPIGLGVWLCHIAGWGILGVLVFGYGWSQRRSLAAFIQPWPLLVPVVPLLLGGGTKGLFGYGVNPIAFKVAIWLKAFRDQSMPLDLITLFVLLALLIRLTLRGKLDGRLGWAALIFALLSLALPRHIAGGDYVDARLIPVALMLGCLAAGQVAVPRWLLWLAAVPFLIRLAVTTLAWHANGQAAERMLLALDEIPQGARVAGAVAVDKLAWPIDPFEHLPSYALVRRSALVNSLFAVPELHMLRVTGADAGFVDPWHRLLFEPGQRPDMTNFAPLKQADYLWYIGSEPVRGAPADMTVLYRSGHSFMARLAKPVDHR